MMPVAEGLPAIMLLHSMEFSLIEPVQMATVFELVICLLVLSRILMWLGFLRMGHLSRTELIPVAVKGVLPFLGGGGDGKKDECDA